MMLMRPFLPLMLFLLVAGPAVAQQNPLLRPSPLSPGAVSSSPQSAVEQERARLYRDTLAPAVRDGATLDARGKLDPLEQRRLHELQREARRVDQALVPPPAPLVPSQEAVDETLHRDRVPGTLERLPPLGHGGATLKPGSRPDSPPPEPAPAADPRAATAAPLSLRPPPAGE